MDSPSDLDLVRRMLDEFESLKPFERVRLTQGEAGKEVSRLRGDACRRLVLALLSCLPALQGRLTSMEGSLPPGRAADRLRPRGLRAARNRLRAANEVCELLLRRDLPFQEKDLEELLHWEQHHESVPFAPAPQGALKACEDFAQRERLSDGLRQRIRIYADHLKTRGESLPDKKLLRRAEKLLADGPQLPPLPPGLWSESLVREIQELPEGPRASWMELMTHASSLTATTPSRKWRREAASLAGRISPEDLRSRINGWLTSFLGSAPWSRGRAERPESTRTDPIDPAAVPRGLVWSLAAVGLHDRETARVLTRLAIAGYSKSPTGVARSPKIANASIWILGEMPGPHGVAGLSLLKFRLKRAEPQRAIRRSLQEAQESLGVDENELDELAVPDYGLTDVGAGSFTIGDFRAELRVTGGSSTVIEWIRELNEEKRKTQKSVPSCVKSHHAAELAEIRATERDIRTMLPAQKDRLDQLFLDRREWTLATWRSRYLDHPLVGTLARRLLWRFQYEGRCVAGVYHAEKIVGVDGEPMERLPRDTIVRLWHPLDDSPSNVARWREWLEEHRISQPFKQAHREIYVITEAELATETYSNRYAAHVLKQQQFHALCRSRGWKSPLRLRVDAEYPPTTRNLPRWGLRAEFWVEGLGHSRGDDTHESGAYRHLTTDQVRFYRQDATQHRAHALGGGYAPGRQEIPEPPIPLREVDPLVFSEVLRDVDLFVAVTSVGNDPTWSDGGGDTGYADYWYDTSFGDLNATAKTRRRILEGIVPKLKISDRCTLADRFLIVRGDLRTYKIHLGSGNVLMSPNDQYLCIVQAQGTIDRTGSRLFLPFEGDRTLSLILSKAMLLAADREITDPTIVSQIGRS